MNGKEVPSQSAANAVMRVLVGKPLKYTVRVHKADGSVTEFQCDDSVRVVHLVEARSLWLCQGDYENKPIMPYESGMVILREENPK